VILLWCALVYLVLSAFARPRPERTFFEKRNDVLEHLSAAEEKLKKDLDDLEASIQVELETLNSLAA
jgi:F0F1-type ATP synthase membrane subunit b/b'